MMVGLVVSALRRTKSMSEVAQSGGITSGQSRKTVYRSVRGVDMEVADESDDEKDLTVVTVSLSLEPCKSTLLADELGELQKKLGIDPTSMRLAGSTLVVSFNGRLPKDVVASDLDPLSRFALTVRNERLEQLCNTVHTSTNLTARRDALDLLAESLPSHERTRAAFYSVLDDGNPGLVLDAAIFLARTDQKPLLELVADTTAPTDHRRRAIGALAGHTDDNSVLYQLLELVENDALEELRSQAVELLLEEDCRIPRALCRILSGRAESEALLAARVLGRSRVKPDIETLFELLQRPERSVQAEAIDSLGKVGSTADVSALKEARKTSQHRDAIDRAIRRIQTRGEGDRGSLSLSDGFGGGELTMSTQEGALTLEDEPSKCAVSEADEEQVAETADG